MQLRLGLLFVFLGLWLGYVDANVSVTIKGLFLTLSNGHFTAEFNAAKATAVYINGVNVVTNLGGKASFYIDYSDGKDEGFNPTVLKLVSKTNDLVHVAYYHESTSDLTIEEHFMVSSNVNGIYQYVVIKNNAGKTLSLGEIRMVCRFNPSVMKYVHNGKFSMETPLYADLAKDTKVQDETWKLPDGTYYSKYDLADYVRERNFFGVFGGGYGAWFIHPSHEYFSGGPLKQDLIVHQDALMATYMTGGHFGTPALSMVHGFQKMYGPWLIYFNTGSDSALVSDVTNQAQKEIAKWPYTFVVDSLYPHSRGIVEGTVRGKKSMVVLSPEGEEFDLQTKGYSYNAEANNGGFYIKNVRPGNYLVTVYPIAGAAAGTVHQSKVTVTAGKTTNAGTFTITEPNVIWQIGEADRRSSEFLYSNEKRNYKWHLLPPASLTFKVGTSTAAKNWYYAQVQKGTWTIDFTDKADGRARSLLISVAGASVTSTGKPKLHISFNGKIVATVGQYENDQAIYRSAMQSGNYHFQKIDIPAASVKTGTNVISIDLVQGSFLYDCIVYTRD